LVASLALPLNDSSNQSEMKIDNRFDEIKSQTREKSALVSSVQDAGTLWDHPKGNKKIVLSVSSGDLVDTKNGRLLEKADPTMRKEFAERWLKIRPQGGRVFIDSEGHASTLIDDRLVYLGNVTGLLS